MVDFNYSCGVVDCDGCEHCDEELAEIAEAHKVADANSVTVPPGEYFLGDPSYAFRGDQDAWESLLQSCDFFEKPVGKSPDGMEVVAFSTAWGDGLYPGNDGEKYYIGCGLIGLVPVTPATEAEFARHKDAAKFAQRVKFDEPASCKSVVRSNAGEVIGNVMFFGPKRVWT
jgi:hypothetical protein